MLFISCRLWASLATICGLAAAAITHAQPATEAADARAALEESSRTIRQTVGIQFKSRTTATGMLKDVIDLSGTTKVWRPTEWTAPLWRVDGVSRMQGKPDEEIHAACDGFVLTWIDDKRAMHAAPTDDPAAANVLAMCRELLPAFWTALKPFDVILTRNPTRFTAAPAVAGGVNCTAIETPGLAQDTYQRWSIGTQDNLPRAFELGLAKPSGNVSKTTEFSDLTLTTLTRDDFILSFPGVYFVTQSPTTAAAQAAKPEGRGASGAALSSPGSLRAETPSAVLAASIAPAKPAPASTAPPATPTPTATAPTEAPLGPRIGGLPRTDSAQFISDTATLRLDPSRPHQVIPIRLPQPTDGDLIAEVESSDPAILTIEHGAHILPNQSLAYAVVRPRSVGIAHLTTGASSITVRVLDAAPRGSAADAFGPAPRLISPTSGAAVWSTVHISVATWREDGESTPTLKLRVGGDKKPDTKLLDPVWINTSADGPLALASFAVDFAALPAGPCELLPIRIDARGAQHPGDPATVQVVALDPAAITSGECEMDYAVILPNHFGPPKPSLSVGNDPRASGGKFFNNASAEPRFRYQVNVPSDTGAGWYQVMLTAGGDAATSALPSVGITIDEAQRPTTSSALAQPAFHRTPIGTPIRLDTGRHILRLDFLNDFAVRGTDRNLRLDAFEIARVAGAHSEPSGASRRSDSAANMQAMSGDSMMAAQSGDQMMMSGGNASASTSSATWPASALAATRPPVRIAFNQPIDGLTVSGELELRGTSWWEDQKNSPPPQVLLMVNGRERARQRSDAPRFSLAPESLAAGDNTVQLIAVADNGLRAQTAEQHITLPASLARANTSESVRAERRFTIHDPVWSPSFSKSLKENAGGEQRKAGILANCSQVALDLPPDLRGEFDVYLECRSNAKAGAPERRVDLELVSGEAKDAIGPPTPVASRTAPNWLDAHRFTTETSLLSLQPGPKTLWITVPSPDGKWTPGKGQKEAVYLQAIRLIQRTDRSHAGPNATLDYPAENQELFGADALVASVTSGNTLEWAETVIDGQTPDNTRFDLRRQGGLGRVVLPLSLRGLTPGTHTVSIRIGDSRNHTVQTLSRTVRILDTAPEGGTTYERALTILDRFAYGPEPRQLADILTLGIDEYLNRATGCCGSSTTARADNGRDATSQSPEDDLAALRLPNMRSGYDVPRRAIAQAIGTDNPVRNRFTLWAENHFSTWVRKDEAWRKWDEHERFTALGIAPFYDLLRTSATSPAMLRYLDQERSYASRLNENYAREIMELHTLGVHGGYTQQDVTNLAHVLTGWTTARVALASVPESTADEDGLVEEFRFEPVVASKLSEMRDVVGFRFVPQDKSDQHERVLLALEVLSSHPSAARFVCTKLASHYVGVPPPEDLIDDLASTFTRTGGDMREVLLTMSRHPSFWKAAMARRLAHPTDYAFRLARCTGSNGWYAPHEIGDFLNASGHGLFDRPTPDGYPELDTEAMDSNAILQRWKLASRADGALAEVLPPGIRWSSGPMNDATRQYVVDILAIRLTGRLLGDSSNAEALKVLDQAAPPADAPIEQRNHDAQIKTCATFIAQLPEANLR